MDIFVFGTGFILGAIVVLIGAYVVNKRSRSVNEEIAEQMKLYFENTANKVLKENSAQFSEQSKERLDDFFVRFKDKIESFEKRSEENFKIEAEKFTIFDTNLKSFLDVGNKISNDTSVLKNVMKGDNRTQGHWGEIVLEKVLEASGLRKDEEYKVQSGTAEGRPDATVFLPMGRCVYIDAKTSLSSWYGYVNAKDEAEKEEYYKDFVLSTKAHISGLAKRDYSVEETSPDYVLMFIPIEGCYSLMFCENSDLWDLAWKNKVMPVSPSTLLAALKIINAFHIVDKQNKNAIEISRLCGSMIDKFATLLSDIKKVRTGLDSSLAKLQGRGNIISQIEKIQDLGVIISKEIPELPEELELVEK